MCLLLRGYPGDTTSSSFPPPESDYLTVKLSWPDETGRAPSVPLVRFEPTKEPRARPRLRVLGGSLAFAWTARARSGSPAADGALGGLERLARLALRLYREHPLGRADALSRLLARSHALRQARQEERATLRDIRHWLVPELAMARPWAAFATLELPRIVSERELADFVGILPDDLDWFADPKRLNRATRAARLRHYDYRWVAEETLGRLPLDRSSQAPAQGSAAADPRRHLESSAVARGLPRSSTWALGDHIRGSARGTRIGTSARPGRVFRSVREVRVRILFEALGYPDRVAATLAALCCTPTPEDVLKACPLPRDASPAERDEAFLQRRKLRDAHLPQGAPTSPALANLSAFRLDLRLSALARKLGSHYTRYADDLAFSGDAHFRAVATKALPRIGAIVLEEGFQLRYRKTRTMSESQRQRLCGVVVDRAPSLPRKELELLEAILFNCIRSGPTSQIANTDLISTLTCADASPG